MFQVAISVPNWSHSLQCILLIVDFMLRSVGGLSKCLRLLMWVNQHRHSVGVWIPNPWGERALACVVLFFKCKPSSGALSLGWKHPVRVLTARNAAGQWSGQRQSPSSTLGIWPRGESEEGHPECYLESLLFFPCSVKNKFLSVL